MRCVTLRVVVSLCAFILGVAFLACWPGHAALTQQTSTHTQSQQSERSSSTNTAHGFDVSSMDRSVGACQDFNHFANGGWVGDNPIPPSFLLVGGLEGLALLVNEAVAPHLRKDIMNTRL